MMSKSTIEKMILQCVDEGLRILGESGRKAVYYCLESDFKLKRSDIPRRPEVFCKGLTIIFGKEGAGIIQKRIMERLGYTFHLNCPVQATLTKVVNEIKKDPNMPSDSLIM